MTSAPAFRSRAATPARSGGRRRTETLDLVRVGRLVWSELPLLATINLLVALAATVALATALTAVVLAPLVAALLFGPVVIAAVAACDRLLGGEAVGIRDLVREIRRRARTGVALALVPATVVTLLLGSLALPTTAADRRWVLVPIAIDAAVLIVLAFGCLTVFPLAVATELRGRARWFAAIGLAGQNLTASLGLVAIPILLALSVTVVGPFLALIAAAPFCLLTTAATRSFVPESTA